MEITNDHHKSGVLSQSIPAIQNVAATQNDFILVYECEREYEFFIQHSSYIYVELLTSECNIVLTFQQDIHKFERALQSCEVCLDVVLVYSLCSL